MIDPRTPQPGMVNFEDVPTLLGAILSEKLLQAQRSLGPDGQWQWSYPDPRNIAAGVEAPLLVSSTPPLVVSDENLQLILNLLNTLANGERMFFWRVGAVMPPPGVPKTLARWYMCEIVAPDGSGQILANGGAEVLSAAIGMAISRLTSTDIEAAHRELFPGRYMALSS